MNHGRLVRRRWLALTVLPVAVVVLSNVVPSTVASGRRCVKPYCPPVSRQAAYRLGRGTASVALLVEPDDGVSEVVKGINDSVRTVMVSSYLLSQHRIVHALDRAAAQGVAVFVMLDQHPYGVLQQPQTMFSLLRASGIHVRWAPSYFEYSHAKFMILDDEVLVLSSANFTQSGFSSDRDFVVLDDAPLDVRQADNIFRADWDHIAPVLNDSDLFVSPVNARGKFYQLLARAKHYVDLYSEEVLDQGIVRRLLALAHRGVHVRVLTATITAAFRKRLTRAGVAVGPRPSVAGLYIHAKAMVVDDQVAFVGSENFSSTSLDQNRELGVLVNQPAAIHRIEATFRHDWQLDRP